MADWIKMRSSLLTNPKVIRMARELLKNPEFMEWLCPGRPCATRDETVTKRDIPVVTRIVVGALLPTWSAVNDTAARDGVVRHATSQDIDESAGVPGFGRALIAVAWLRELPEGEGVQFINFEEHNSPQKERSLTAKSGAERTKEYRDRKAAERDAKKPGDEKRDAGGDGRVTSHGDDREEESRGEKNKNPSGSKPSGKPTRKAKSAKRAPDDFEVTQDLIDWAAENAPQIDWRKETAKFRDWEFQHARSDWSAVWRTWLRKAQETAEKNGVTPRGQEVIV